MSNANEKDIRLTDEEAYRLERTKSLEEEKLNGLNVYPHKFHITTSFPSYRRKYFDLLENGERKTEWIECVAGRVQEKRNAGKKLYFYTVFSDGVSLQYLVDKRIYENKDNFNKDNKRIHRGDIVGVRGFVGKSKRGELSIFPLKITLLSPCLKYIPKLVNGLKDTELRYKKKWFDLISNPESRDVLIKRSKIFSEVRNFLNGLDFVEVQTPILSTQQGGASAKPFVTYHNDLKQNMYLRVAPELYLKKLVVGGLNRVYEIGQQFRNESIDTTHIPEFCSMEFYMAYADYNDLMEICENMLTAVVNSVNETGGSGGGDGINSENKMNNENNTLKVKYLPIHQKEEITIDFTPPYKRIDIVNELETKVGRNFPDDLSSQQANLFLDELCKEYNVGCESPRTNSRLIDKLIGHFIEPECVNPTFLINHPRVMSPLAKTHRVNPNLTERFELFVNGMELANAYTELNDPTEQLERFKMQMQDREQGDDEAQPLDETFIDALEYGLPPTGGFGLGLERLVMILTNNCRIREVISFPPIV